MQWSGEARGTYCGDWRTSGRLSRVDPYLVWWDLTDFSGTPLPASSNPVLPVTLERRGRRSAGMSYRTRGISLSASALQDLVDRGRSGHLRYEAGTGFATGGFTRNAPPLHLPCAAGRGGRTALLPRPVIGFIDYGCAFAHRQFRRPHGATWTTRVLALWDQSEHPQRSRPPAGIRRLQWRFPTDFQYGAETHRDATWEVQSGALNLHDYIRQFERRGSLDEESLYRFSEYAAVVDRRWTHGTHVMDLATGQPDPLRFTPLGRAGQPVHDADIVFVQLPRTRRGREITGLLGGNVLDGIRYIQSCAQVGQPVVINLSYGANVGPHDGSSVLERAIDWRLQRARQDLGSEVHLVVPSGNARDRKMHASGLASPGGAVEFHWHAVPDDPSDSFVEIWFPDSRDFEVAVEAPDGSRVAVGPGSADTLVDSAGRVVAAVVAPHACCQSERGRMVLLALAGTLPRRGGRMAPFGRWKIVVDNRCESMVTIDAWGERDDPPAGTLGQPRQGYFTDTATTRVEEDRTLNSIAHGNEVIVVGGRVGGGGAAAYSGTGPGRSVNPKLFVRGRSSGDSRRGPEVLAPCDEGPGIPGLVAAAVLGTDQIRLPGTSAAAALMTRRIVDAGFVYPLPPPPAPPAPVIPRPAAPQPAASRPAAPDLAPHPDDDLAAA